MVRSLVDSLCLSDGFIASRPIVYVRYIDFVDLKRVAVYTYLLVIDWRDRRVPRFLCRKLVFVSFEAALCCG